MFSRFVGSLQLITVAFLLSLGASASAQNFLVNKKFITAPTSTTQVSNLGPGQTSYLEFNLFNSASGPLTANITDNLPLGLDGDATFTPEIYPTPRLLIGRRHCERDRRSNQHHQPLVP